MDLSGIVDGVMGPLISYEPVSNSTSYPGSSTGHHEPRHPTDTRTKSSFCIHLYVLHLISEKSYSDPFRSNFIPPIPSSSLPTSASASRMSQMSDTISYPNPAPTSPAYSLSPPFRASPPDTLPRKSGPLASTGHASLWLTQNVRASP